MREPVYFKNYLKIYLWQGLAVVANLLSVVIVVPKIAGQPHVYGIYSLCVSFSLFLTYADIGFVSAGYKYASESYSRKNLIEEISIEGFVVIVLLIASTLFAVSVIVFSFYPAILIRDTTTPEDIWIASRLLLILGIFSYAIVFQRFLQIVFGIRLEDYIYQRINILASILRILSVYYFFAPGRYDIVGFFLFGQVMVTVAGIFCVIIMRKRYQYDLSLLLRSIKFSREVYARTKSLAFGSLYLVVCWVLYYELDPLFLGKMFGARQIAVFAIGLTTISFFRTAFGTMYGPFNARFNHFVGVRDYDGLKTLLNKLLAVTLPVTLVPVLCLIFLNRPFVLSWVGLDYEESVFISKFLLLSYCFSFVSYPASILIVALEKIRQLYIINTILVIIYWGGVLATVGTIGIRSLAIFKFISFAVASVFYFKILVNYLNIGVLSFMRKFVLPVLIPLGVAVIALSLIEPHLPGEKGKMNLMIVVLIGAIGTLGVAGTYYLATGAHKSYLSRFLKRADPV